MADEIVEQPEYPVRLACSVCRWTDVSYTTGHHRAHVKLGHKVDRDPSARRCIGNVIVVTDDASYPKGSTHTGAEPTGDR